MAKHFFKQAVKFVVKNEEGAEKEVHFKNGAAHEVSPEIEDHHYFKTLQKAGLVVGHDGPEELPAETFGERQKRLADQLAAEQKAKLEKAKVEKEADEKEEKAIPEAPEAPLKKEHSGSKKQGK